MKVSKEEVLKIARLARLKLKDDEGEMLREDLDEILEYVDRLKSLREEMDNTKIVKGKLETNFREDIMKSSFSQEEALFNSPLVIKEYIRIPKVVNVFHQNDTESE